MLHYHGHTHKRTFFRKPRVRGHCSLHSLIQKTSSRGRRLNQRGHNLARSVPVYHLEFVYNTIKRYPHCTWFKNIDAVYIKKTIEWARHTEYHCILLSRVPQSIKPQIRYFSFCSNIWLHTWFVPDMIGNVSVVFLFCSHPFCM